MPEMSLQRQRLLLHIDAAVHWIQASFAEQGCMI